MIQPGYCQCGCGQKTDLYTKTRRERGDVEGQPKKYIQYHHVRGNLNPKWNGGRREYEHGYMSLFCPGHPRALNGRYVGEHILVAERVLEKFLPEGAIVHHVDGNRSNNVNSNLVVCQDRAYHSLIHSRMRAKKECGHADWLKCPYCKKYDDQKNMSLVGRAHYHKECRNKYGREFNRGNINE